MWKRWEMLRLLGVFLGISLGVHVIQKNLRTEVLPVMRTKVICFIPRLSYKESEVRKHLGPGYRLWTTPKKVLHRTRDGWETNEIRVIECLQTYYALHKRVKREPVIKILAYNLYNDTLK